MPELMRFSILLLALILSGTVLADQARIELLPLKHRVAEEVIPLLRPLMGPEEGLSGTGYQLILKTAPENLANIREALKTIDTAPRRLRIIVRQDADTGRSGTDIGIRSSQADEEAAAIQQLMTLEGSPAFIRVGQSVPVTEHRVDWYGYGAQVYDFVQYRDITTGFYVLPRVRDDHVTLEISPYRQALDPGESGQIDAQEIRTTVSARLGEWIDLGGAAEQQHQRNSDILYSTRDARSDRRRVFVKVEEVP